MPDPVRDAADVTNRVMDFLRKHYSFVVPVKAERSGAWWIVEADVGLTKPTIVRVRVNPGTGEIHDFQTIKENVA